MQSIDSNARVEVLNNWSLLFEVLGTRSLDCAM